MSGDASTSRVWVLGSPVDAGGTLETVERILAWTETDKVHIAVGINAHVCNTASSNLEFGRQLADVDLAYPDGQSIVWAARFLGAPIRNRVATTDLIVPLAKRASTEGLNLFFFGGAPGVAKRAAAKLRGEYPLIKISTNHGYLAYGDSKELLDEIHAHKTDILFVGLGDPKQLAWVADNRSDLKVAAVLTCGGLFDWISGDNKRAPYWMIASGLEWLWRVMIEPRRLGRRYIVGNPLFVARFARQWIKLKWNRI